MSGIAFYPPATNTERIPTDTGCTEMKNAMPAGRRIRESENVRIFQAVFKRVFRGQKNSGLLFEISGSDFKIRATNFFFAPMWGERAENQFSFFLA